MWGGGVEHGSQEAAHHQLLPWLAAAPFSEPAVAAGFGAMGAYACDGVGGLGLGHGGVFGFGFDAVQQQQQRAAEGSGNGKAAAVSGLLGSLQAELGRMTAREMMDAKALAASRSHSEAERRRRQRINGHLARLRSLLPNTTKTDKASLLAEVLDHVKELKRQTSAMMAAAAAAVAGDDEGAAGPAQMLPTEADELSVDAAVDRVGQLVLRASLCCEDRPDLIPDIVRALAALRMRARRAEITTLGGRVRSVLLITADDEGADDDHQGDDEDDDGRRLNARLLRGDDDDHERTASSRRRHECIASVQEALRGVMDRRAASSDTSSSGGGGGSIKRQRMNYGGAQEHCSG
ncbi:Transcription factor bHLH30 [Dichanthelium oligosanthes]|uniref:Transcription factor bHLH30 n=1 Tax=Dichanthelium oligosanthes TaxID=888268 RepID=A0A1E5UTR8_9POAL|nr:Transcription factor bHLH30 [Dichanthelium oligosanthes]